MYEFAEIEIMATRIKAGLICRVYLFGSYAWGSPDEDSDVDLAVIVPDDSQIKKPDIVAARLSMHGLIPIDVIWLRESTLAKGLEGSLSFEIRTKGVEI